MELEARLSRTPGGRSRTRIIGAVVLGMVAAGALVAYFTTSTPQVSAPLVGRTHLPAPAFSLPELSHPQRDLSLAHFRGRDLVVNFWASWCIPCRTEMPLLESASRSGGRSVRFLGIDTNDTSRGAALAFVEKTRVTYPVLYDPNGVAATEYGLVGMPTTVFISARGVVLGSHIGQFDADSLQASLAQAFGTG